ncbi:hypothetical protein [Priestia flexa]|uniref:hypothetical protein n=1 Tax=Priestia flexa TaxID=86664 RepID=UPI003FD6B526
MARKNRSLTTFDEVSSDHKNDTEKNKENEIENGIKKNKENDIEKDKENEIKEEASKLDLLLSGKHEKKEEKIATLLHLEKEVAKALDKAAGGKKKGRSGLKSQIANEILKEVLIAKGFLKQK